MADPHEQLAVALFSEVFMADQLARNRISRALPKGMELSHFSVLNHLANVADERTPAQLADAFHVTRGAMTNTLAKLEWAGHIGLPVHVLLTKADKLKRGPAQNTLLKVQATLRAMSADFSVQTFSSLKRSGIDAAHARLDEWFGFAESTTAPV